MNNKMYITRVIQFLCIQLLIRLHLPKTLQRQTYWLHLIHPKWFLFTRELLQAIHANIKIVFLDILLATFT